MSRIYLFVPPEKDAELRSLGAAWDAVSKRWYVESNEVLEKFSRWLPSAEEDDNTDEEFTLVSSEAFVAATTIPCQQCGTGIEVICIHCRSGLLSGDPLNQFTVTATRTVDEALARQLERWPTYRRVLESDGSLGEFANHCSHCGRPQEDMYLHSEPDAPFFDIVHASAGSITLFSLAGTVRLNGDEHFTVE